MENKSIAIWLWGQVLGFLSWDDRKHCSYFVFDESFLESGWDVAPLWCSIKSPSALLPRHGNVDKLYAGLPPFVADSLPDRWGNHMRRYIVKDGVNYKRFGFLSLMHSGCLYLTLE